MTKRLARPSGLRVGAKATDTGAVILPQHTVANAPSASGKTGHMIYVSNGAAGTAIAAVSDGTNWKRVDTWATISAT